MFLIVFWSSILGCVLMVVPDCDTMADDDVSAPERIWEEFTQSIHTFIEDKKNLAQHTHGKKKATLIVILSIRFTKLIIYHLQRKHKFHPRPDSLLQLPNEEPVLGYLKFSAKGTKKEVFGMPILGNLITTDIQGESYYQEYLVKVSKHQIYLAGETGSDLDSPAPKPTKTTKKSKPTAPKADPRPPVSKPASSQQPEHKPAPAKTQGKKLDESVAEAIPEKEPRVDDEEADVYKALEESVKSIYDVPRGPLPLAIIREPEFEKYQSLPETPKKKSPTDQYIFQRRTSTPIGSSGHDESSSLYAKLGLTDSEVESNEDVPGIDAGVQGEGHVGPNLDDQDEGQAGPNPDEQAKGQLGPNPDDSTQPHPEQMDEGFIATSYPKVQENLKLTVEDQVILEEPASSIGTLSSLQHLTKDLSFGDLFFNDKPSEADNEKTTAETEAESMVSDIIQLDTSRISPMRTSVFNLTSRLESPNVHRPLQATATETTTTTTPPIHPPPSQLQQSTTDPMLMKRIGELEHIMANLIQENKHLEERDLPEADMKEILHQRIWETNSYKTHEDHKMLYEDLVKSLNCDHSEELAKDLAEARKKKKKRRDFTKNATCVSTSSATSSTTTSRSIWSFMISWSFWILTSAATTSSTSIHQPRRTPQTPNRQRGWLNPQAYVNKPLPLGGPPGQVTIQFDFFFNKDLEYLRYGSKGSRPALSILKMKAAYYPDVSLEKMVPGQMWIEEECKHTSEDDHGAVRTHIRILNVVRIKVFSMYGYDYMKKIVFRRADLNEHTITE
nr:E-beta-farnesene synthase [Tanacetum cinerariifolium]